MSFRAETQTTGTSLPAGDRPVGGVAELVGRDRLAFEVAAHQVLVGLDDLLDDHLVGLGRVHRAVGGDVVVAGRARR